MWSSDAFLPTGKAKTGAGKIMVAPFARVRLRNHPRWLLLLFRRVRAASYLYLGFYLYPFQHRLSAAQTRLDIRIRSLPKILSRGHFQEANGAGAGISLLASGWEFSSGPKISTYLGSSVKRTIGVSPMGTTGAAGSSTSSPAISDTLGSVGSLVVREKTGEAYISDLARGLINRVANASDPTSGIETLLGPTLQVIQPGVAQRASVRLRTPDGLSLDSEEEYLYFSDAESQRVLRVHLSSREGIHGPAEAVVNPEGAIGAAGNCGPATRAKLRYPRGLAIITPTKSTDDGISRGGTSTSMTALLQSNATNVTTNATDNSSDATNTTPVFSSVTAPQPQLIIADSGNNLIRGVEITDYPKCVQFFEASSFSAFSNPFPVLTTFFIDATTGQLCRGGECHVRGSRT
ncbi:unnamed protein product, partial [Amoebophrya sp. A25]